MVSMALSKPPGRSVHAAGAYLCGVWILAACGDAGDNRAPAPLVMDSAGVEVVTNPAIDAVYADVVPEPILSIGTFDGAEPEIFGRIVSVALDGSGNLIVADQQAAEIRTFDAQGEHLRSFGRTGDGPGEFQALLGAWPTAEGAIVATDARGRIVRFDSTGALLTTATLIAPNGAATRPVRPAGPDLVLGRARSALPSPESGQNLEELLESLSNPVEQLVRHDLSGALIDTVATVFGQAVQASSSGGSISIMRVPLSARSAATASSTGRVAVTRGQSYEISLFDPDGNLERIVRLTDAPPVLTDAHLGSWVRNSPGGWESSDETQIEAVVSEFRNSMAVPERLPAWSSLLFADGGELWAQRYATSAAETIRWDVFGADGGFLGRVTVPASFRIQHVGNGRLTVVSSDDLGVERVEVYELG